MAVVVLAIWLEGGRPIFFSQLRLGQVAVPVGSEALVVRDLKALMFVPGDVS